VFVDTSLVKYTTRRRERTGSSGTTEKSEELDGKVEKTIAEYRQQ
jgi:hypothetical protein